MKLSIVTKSTILVICVTLVTACLFSYIHYTINNDFLRKNAENRLFQDNQHASKIITSYIEDLRREIFLLSKFPPIRGIIRAKNNGNIDPVDGSTLQQWQKRLESILASSISTKKHYVSISYLDTTNQLGDIITVNHLGASKTSPSYVINNINITRDISSLLPGEIYISKTYKAPGGQKNIYLDVGIPIYDTETKTIFGIVVLTVNYSSALEIFDNYAKDHNGESLYITDMEQNIIFYSGNITFDQLQKNNSLLTNRSIVSFDELDTSKNLNITVAYDYSYVIDHMSNVGVKMIFFVIISICIAGSIGVFFSYKILLPIRKLTDKLNKVVSGKTTIDDIALDVHSKDEIGMLSQSFTEVFSELKIKSNNLRKAHKKTELILQSMHEGICGINNEGLIVFSNQAAQRQLGYTPKNIVGIEQYKVFPNSNNRKKGMEYQGKAVMRDGSKFPIEYTITNILNDKNNIEGIFIVFRDITIRHKIQQDILAAKEDAESMAQSKASFLANMSHEIRTPMNGIIGVASLLKKTSLNRKQLRYVDTINSSSESLLTIINDILDFSKIDAGKLDLEEITFNLPLLIEEVSDLMSAKINERGLELFIHIKPDVPPNLLGDPGRIKQIIYNLVGNAIKFTEHGHIIISINLQKIVNGRSYIQFSIKDTGIGIPKDRQKNIFAEFTQQDSSTTRKYGGTGLGLAICEELSKKMGGGITLDSQPGIGSTFTFTIGVYVNTDEATEIQNENIDLSNKNILILDESSTSSDLITRQVEDYNGNIKNISFGQNALSEINIAKDNGKPFDMVIISSLIADIKPIELGNKILTKYKDKKFENDDIKLIFLSKTPERGDGKKARESGFSGYLPVPLQSLEAVKMISTILTKNNIDSFITRHAIREKEVEIIRQKTLSFAGANILVAEDNPVNQMVTQEILGNIDCVSTIANNGEEAVELFKNNTYDLIFMDCQMPVMDGFEATDNIRKYETLYSLKHTPIIALTANALKGDSTKCINAGMDDYVSKPISQNNLEKILTKWGNQDVSKITMEDNIKKIGQTKVVTNQSIDKATFDELQQIMPSSFKKLIESYLKMASPILAELKEAIANDNHQDMYEKAHSLKSPSAQIGALQLADLMENIENIGKEKETVKGCNKILKSAEEIFVDVEDQLNSYISVNNDYSV